MTVLEELIDTAYQLCEKHTSRNKDSAGTLRDSRAAVLLGSDGRIFTGIDIYTPLVSSSSSSHLNLNASSSGRLRDSMHNTLRHSSSNNTVEEKTSAEMVALLAAATEGCSAFVVSGVV